jgi:glycosyltransferase involved in cell wall biosynthesis
MNTGAPRQAIQASNRVHPRVLVISDFFPDPGRLAYGIFVERQTTHSASFCDPVVVVPTRIFPPQRVWKEWRQLTHFRSAWGAWRHELHQIPAYDDKTYGYPVHYPRYTSPPRQLIHALWGFFAYPFVAPLLRRLHEQQGFDLVHAHYATASGVIGLLARRWMNIPVMISVHGIDVTYSGIQNRAGRAITAWAFREANLVTANSQWTAERISALARPCSLEILRLGGDLPYIADQPTMPARDRLTLLSVGYLEERKGYTYMLHAVRRLIDDGYDVQYQIVGDGSHRGAFERLSDQLGLRSRVCFAGYKAHHEVWLVFCRRVISLRCLRGLRDLGLSSCRSIEPGQTGSRLRWYGWAGRSGFTWRLY